MITENILTELTEQMNLIPFGARLKAARESMKLDVKDAAARLRLNERIILMMENDNYPSDLPPTFIRGYIRSYGKLLQIPEEEIAEAVEPIKPTDTVPPQAPVTIQQMPLTSSNYLVQGITYIVILTLLGLVGLWWHSHNMNTKKSVPLTLPEPSSQSVTDEELTSMNNPVASGQPVVATPPTPDAMINTNPAIAPTAVAPTPPQVAPTPPVAAAPLSTEPQAANPSAEPKYLQHPQANDAATPVPADDAILDDGSEPSNTYTTD